ncbi:MAG TPA: class I SAM-dependent methyltransferase [Anaerolineae bacterium]|nr:class I SAM-dependent methyltransferase [Anaerolineae bacterium]
MEPPSQKLVRAALRFFFEKLYTTFAWTYDLVAWISSMGQWRDWQSAALEDLPEGDILEIGHGTGYLVFKLMQSDRKVFGIDPSRQMTRTAKKRLQRSGYHPLIIQSKAQRLPLPHGRFSAILCTFPSAYIFDPATLSEAHRVLQSEGMFVIVGSVRITGRGLHDRFAAWLYRVTGQTGGFKRGWDQPFLDHGFTAHLEEVTQQRAIVFRVIARKEPKIN